MFRRTFFLAAPLLALLPSFVYAAEQATLDAETMKAALHTASPEEDGFIAYVLGKVDNGTLPLDLVESTFQWARQKPKNKFQYFKRGLTLRAARQGIRL